MRERDASRVVEINGAVQALMTAGLGFSMEQTGLENIKTSLLYNGLVGRTAILP